MGTFWRAPRPWLFWPSCNSMPVAILKSSMWVALVLHCCSIESWIHLPCTMNVVCRSNGFTCGFSGVQRFQSSAVFSFPWLSTALRIDYLRLLLQASHDVMLPHLVIWKTEHGGKLKPPHRKDCQLCNVAFKANDSQ